MLLVSVCGMLAGCSDDSELPGYDGENSGNGAVSDEIFYANVFGKDVMNLYYYWNKDISEDLEQWDIETNEDPIGTLDKSDTMRE